MAVSERAVFVGAVAVVVSVMVAMAVAGSVPEVTIVCIPPCSNGEVICTWDHGGNGYNGSTDCQRHCGDPVGSGSACKASSANTCYWGFTNDTGWACISGPPPCATDNEIMVSAYLTCAQVASGYGGCTHIADCAACCSKACYCQDLVEDKSVCRCGKKIGPNQL